MKLLTCIKGETKIAGLKLVGKEISSCWYQANIYGKNELFISQHFTSYSCILILPVPIPGEEGKLTQTYIFTLPSRASKGFMKVFF